MFRCDFTEIFFDEPTPPGAPREFVYRMFAAFHVCTHAFGEQEWLRVLVRGHPWGGPGVFPSTKPHLKPNFFWEEKILVPEGILEPLRPPPFDA